MKLIKLAIISFIVLFVIITAIGLLLPATVRVTRNITIHATQDTLYHYISDVKYWKLWMEGAKSGTVTFISKKTAGAGTKALIGNQRVDITKATKKEVVTVWQNSNERYQTGIFQLVEDSTTGSTNLNWYFEQKLNWYPWERISAIANDKIIGPGMEQSLDNLKAIFEGVK
ncbi:hypothetical protein FC093_07180 [Ilyomonas limi]|uniref:Polyketide cyclase n=1 Tax=Ilyomonas limi TaxID=2575867 RepID=A0A4U3L4E5_9BACT|nr:SRPBCC family protein [Ilyomonas limi]TKK69850.1 hypothetical protein FC093_07180 [Ilyomonas limi]